jgi:DOPA 4,5-dioxygenase
MDANRLKEEWNKVAAQIENYDVHIYVGNDNVTDGILARRLAEALVHTFPDATSKVYDVPAIGPHTQSNFEVVIDKKALGEVMQFLQMNRDHLSVLVHPHTGDEMRDHHESALWLGDPVPLSKPFFDAWNKKHGNRPPQHG